jgi:hypothetical protein
LVSLVEAKPDEELEAEVQKINRRRKNVNEETAQKRKNSTKNRQKVDKRSEDKAYSVAQRQESLLWPQIRGSENSIKNPRGAS